MASTWYYSDGTTADNVYDRKYRNAHTGTTYAPVSIEVRDPTTILDPVTDRWYINIKVDITYNNGEVRTKTKHMPLNEGFLKAQIKKDIDKENPTKEEVFDEF